MAVPQVSHSNKKAMAVPSHIPWIPKPQEQYHILVNNSNEPFPHVWLSKTTADNNTGHSKPIHPLESFSPADFLDSKTDLENLKPIQPAPLDSTPFTYVDNVDNLRELAKKLQCADEFAVDLEHNSYRSYQGLTCLMQISTRSEDFVIDTLKLHSHIGPYLREAFGDPKKRKVMHGACNDIMWLQRDFGIYVCNMFDTFEASKVLKLERKSLAYLLMYFCGVIANKEYQTSDWRLRPLPAKMMKYARDDTHYLLYVYDMMRKRLCSRRDYMNVEEPLLKVYEQSFQICAKLYEKEIFDESSYLKMHELTEANLNHHQLVIVAVLCKWRDTIARAEDESIDYIASILPNQVVMEIARSMPSTESQLLSSVVGACGRHHYVERNLPSLVQIIRGLNIKADQPLKKRCVPAYRPVCVPVYPPIAYHQRVPTVYRPVGIWCPQPVLY